jgi:carbohydrate-selective porin OprB
MSIGRATSTVPDTVADEQPGRTKYGFGVNIEQPLANDGETGLFARAGWSNGANSAWSYTEADRGASMGLQVSGRNWGRPEDHFGIAVAVDGLSGSHRHYLAEGGIGMLIGDGALNYGLEEVFETYYRIQLGRFVQLSPDFQYIQNPGYNRDRGPVKVYGMRLRVSY